VRTWTPEEDRLLLRHRRGAPWAPILARTGRTRRECSHRLERFRVFERKHGRKPKPGELDTFLWRRWQGWEDELLRLALRHLLRPATQPGIHAANVANVGVRRLLARVLGRTIYAVELRLWFLDYDPEELEDL